MIPVQFRVTFERDCYPETRSNEPEENLVTNPSEAARIAYEMANRPSESGGDVIVHIVPLKGTHMLSLFEPGLPLEMIDSELQEKFNSCTQSEFDKPNQH